MPTRKTSKKPVRSYADLFGRLGFPVTLNGSPEAVAEQCPFCGNDRCHLNIETGQYHCKHCEASGNVSDFLNWLHRCCFKATTNEQYQRLKARERGIAIQTLKKHELAYKANTDEWLIPFKNPKGRIVNLQLYQVRTGSKYNLPGLPCSLSTICTNSATTTKRFYFCVKGPSTRLPWITTWPSNERSTTSSRRPVRFKSAGQSFSGIAKSVPCSTTTRAGNRTGSKSESS